MSYIIPVYIYVYTVSYSDMSYSNTNVRKSIHICFSLKKGRSDTASCLECGVV